MNNILFIIPKKAEIIKLENGLKLNRQTVYYHESTYSESFITQKEENLKKLLKECKIEPNGIYHYDEEFLHENGVNTVRLAIIDAVTNLIINDQVIYQEDFDQDFVEIFLKYSLEGLPKKILITDGHIMYPSIIERICIKQQLCIFHIIKYHNDKSYKKMNKIQRRIKTLKIKIKENEERIKELKEYAVKCKIKTGGLNILKLNKYLLIFLSILILFVFIAQASAADANSTDTFSTVDNDEILSIENDVSNYSELSREIGSGGQIELQHDYYTYDTGNTIEISVNNSFINGKGAVIDMAGSNIGTFRVTGSNVVINNLTIKNANNSAIIWDGVNGTVTNCNFTDNTVDSDGAIYWSGDNGAVSDCTFTNNTAKSYGGAITWDSRNGAVSDCTFTDNAADIGGAITWAGDNGTVNNCALVNNTAPTSSEIYIYDVTTKYLNYNWWGSNTPDWDNLINGTYELSVYAILNMTANPNEIYTSEKSDITTKFIWNGTNTDATNLIPKRNVKLTTNGTLTETEGAVGLISEFSATSDGVYYVNATVDNEIIGVNVKVNPIIPTNINVNTTSLDLSIDEIGAINATLNPPEAGSLEVDYDKTIISVIMYVDTWYVEPKAEGNTTITFSFSGREGYVPAENRTVTVTVKDKPTPRKDLNISGSAEPIIAGENATVIVTGFENATGDVTARIDGGLLSTTIVNGTATFNVHGLTSSTTAFIDYGGDANYNNASTTVNITVIPKSDVNIVAENVTKYYGGSERLVANVYDSELNPIANKTVSITINRITYTRTADENGTVSLAINLGSGTYEAIIQVDSTSVKSSITVLSTLTGKDITKYYRNATQYSVQVFDTTGKAVGAGEVVTFNVHGRFYNRTTDENGIATLNINLPQGEYVITAIIVFYENNITYNLQTLLS